MAKIEVSAVVYDRFTHEYIQRTVECPISDKLAAALAEEINGHTDPSHRILGRGHGDDDTDLDLKTPLRNQERFHADPKLVIRDSSDAEIGGWSFM